MIGKRLFYSQFVLYFKDNTYNYIIVHMQQSIEPRKKCTRCSMDLPVSHFKTKRNGDLYRMCKRCNQYLKEYRSKNICVHGRSKRSCADCAQGPCECSHGKDRLKCIKCKAERRAIQEGDGIPFPRFNLIRVESDDESY